MYKLLIDMVNQTIFIELSGVLTDQQINNYYKDLSYIATHYEPKNYNLLIMENRMDPVPQIYLPNLQKTQELMIPWSNKIACVNGNRTITLMQMKRIEAEARKIIISNTQVVRFKTRDAALHYLF